MTPCPICGRAVIRVALFGNTWDECPESVLEGIFPPATLARIAPDHHWHTVPDPRAATYPHGCGGTYRRHQAFVEERLNDELDGFQCDRCGRTCTREEAYRDAERMMRHATANRPPADAPDHD